ncbi:MAG: hypothetical protein IK036_01750 [Clostridia bacterium]|nr:hypothetical protein [Clostridia bacterium]MBR5976231.1 hypothetical protein [Clostridia bacterium]MBR5991459.1 hypothetical protein [Clostridia bacterium]MBR6479205.1 hypothetical protein [Clostridia bacterium]
MLDKIKFLIKLVMKLVSLALMGVLAYIVYAINPFNMPTIFKRNYPDAFERFPLKLISPFISLDP